MTKMILDKNKILDICSANLFSYKNIINKIEYEPHGILNSEMLLMISLVKYLKLNLIIESGRGRGQSTKIIAESFKNPKYRIISIDYNKYNLNMKISFERLKKYKNLELLFGNSFDLIPNLITERCCILIDGPKGIDSIRLAIKLMNNPLVELIFIHDLPHDSILREHAEKIFNYHFFTDDSDYLKRFKHLDRYYKPSNNFSFFNLFKKKKIESKNYKFKNSLSVQ